MGIDTEGNDMSLTEDERSHLLATARNAIVEKLDLPPVKSKKVSSPIMSSHRGAFVTIKTRGRLRGCIGFIEASRPLKQTIERMAAAAAFQDPRFPPLTADEVPFLEIEISILSPLSLISSPEEILVGVHGLVVESGHNRGLLLPQVAVEYRWERSAFLEHTCQKAGLPSDAWKDPDTRIYTFTAEVFGEER